MPSPITTIDVVGVTGSAFGSGLRGLGARELSTGCLRVGSPSSVAPVRGPEQIAEEAAARSTDAGCG